MRFVNGNWCFLAKLVLLVLPLHLLDTVPVSVNSNTNMVKINIWQDNNKTKSLWVLFYYFIINNFIICKQNKNLKLKADDTVKTNLARLGYKGRHWTFSNKKIKFQIKRISVYFAKVSTALATPHCDSCCFRPCLLFTSQLYTLAMLTSLVVSWSLQSWS